MIDLYKKLKEYEQDPQKSKLLSDELNVYKNSIIGAAPKNIKKESAIVSLFFNMCLTDEEFQELINLNILIDCYLVCLILDLGGIKKVIGDPDYKSTKLTIKKEHYDRLQELITKDSLKEQWDGMEEFKVLFDLNEDLVNEGTLHTLMNYSLALALITGQVI